MSKYQVTSSSNIEPVNIPSVWAYPQTGNNMLFSPTSTKIVPSLLKAKTNMGAALKDSSNPFFKSKYADLNSVKAACEPALSEQGIGVFQPTIQKEGKNYVHTLLLHESGEWFASDTEIVCSKQNDPQALGSAITYARRYGLQSLVGLGAEDDDGESAMGRKFSAPAPTANTGTRSSFRKPTTAAKTATTDSSDDLAEWKS
jgi:hypothetical protein